MNKKHLCFDSYIRTTKRQYELQCTWWHNNRFSFSLMYLFGISNWSVIVSNLNVETKLSCLHIQEYMNIYRNLKNKQRIIFSLDESKTSFLVLILQAQTSKQAEHLWEALQQSLNLKPEKCNNKFKFLCHHLVMLLLAYIAPFWIFTGNTNSKIKTTTIIEDMKINWIALWCFYSSSLFYCFLSDKHIVPWGTKAIL